MCACVCGCVCDGDTWIHLIRERKRKKIKRRLWENSDRFGVVTMVGRKVIEKERHEFGFGVF